MARRNSDNDCEKTFPDNTQCGIVRGLPSTTINGSISPCLKHDQTTNTTGNHQSQYQDDHGPPVTNVDFVDTDFHAQSSFSLPEFQANCFNGSQSNPTDGTYNSNFDFVSNIYIDTEIPHCTPQLSVGSSFDRAGTLNGTGAFDLNIVEAFWGSAVDNGAPNWSQPSMGTDASNWDNSFPICLNNFSTVASTYATALNHFPLGSNGIIYATPSSSHTVHPLSDSPVENFGHQFPVAGLVHSWPNGFDDMPPMSFFDSDIVSQQTSVADLAHPLPNGFDIISPMSSFGFNNVIQQTSVPGAALSVITALHPSLPGELQHTGQALVPQATTQLPTNITSHQFACGHPGCGHRFKRKGDCKRHRRSHSTPHLQCGDPTCTLAFYRKDKVVDHQRRVHGI